MVKQVKINILNLFLFTKYFNKIHRNVKIKLKKNFNKKILINKIFDIFDKKIKNKKFI